MATVFINGKDQILDGLELACLNEILAAKKDFRRTKEECLAFGTFCYTPERQEIFNRVWKQCNLQKLKTNTF